MPVKGPGSTASLGAHQRQLAKTKGQKPEQPPSELPSELCHVWEFYRDIEVGARTSNGFGPNIMLWSEIESWMRITGIELHPWEVSVIKRLDLEFVAIFNEETASGGPG